VPDYADTDSDADGISDAIEGAADTDGDGSGDYLDSDSDADGVDDRDEDRNGDGLLGLLPEPMRRAAPGMPGVEAGRVRVRSAM